jgi:hypothetical protein
MIEELIRNEESLFLVGLCTTGVVGIIVGGCSWALVNALRIITDARLKQRMIDRNMTASDIERVLRANSGDDQDATEKTTAARLKVLAR